MISVIIPFYNEKISVLSACVSSLQKQSFKDFEIILVDDGSTNNSKLKTQNFKLYSQSHQGPGLLPCLDFYGLLGCGYGVGQNNIQ